MENNLTNKAKFFAQYLGQKVLSTDGSKLLFEITPFDLEEDLSKSDFLQLTPLFKKISENLINFKP